MAHNRTLGSLEIILKISQDQIWFCINSKLHYVEIDIENEIDTKLMHQTVFLMYQVACITGIKVKTILI